MVDDEIIFNDDEETEENLPIETEAEEELQESEEEAEAVIDFAEE